MRYVSAIDTSAADNGRQPRHRLLGGSAGRDAFRDAAQEGSPPRPSAPAFHLCAGSLELRTEAALSPSAPKLLIYRALGQRATVPSVKPLPAAFLDALEGQEEVLVTSRENGARGTVPVWFLVQPPGVVYLFTYGFSLKARRWRKDPWVRLSVPGTDISVEGVARFVAPDELDEQLAERVVEHWSMQGAPTVNGLRRSLRDGVHALIRVEAG